VDQEILAYEESELFQGPAFKIRTRFQGGTVTTWMNDRGEPLLETSLNGVVISVLENEDVARKYLAQAALNKDENLLEFGLIKCDTVISDPDRIHTLTVHIVNGIVYAPEFSGFLYHSWNESIVDGRWVAIDPTYGQIPVDATHIKLLEGQNLSDLMPLVDVIGKLKVRILSAE
jgi:hypothetical protein